MKTSQSSKFDKMSGPCQNDKNDNQTKKMKLD